MPLPINMCSPKQIPAYCLLPTHFAQSAILASSTDVAHASYHCQNVLYCLDGLAPKHVLIIAHMPAKFMFINFMGIYMYGENMFSSNSALLLLA